MTQTELIKEIKELEEKTLKESEKAHTHRMRLLAKFRDGEHVAYGNTAAILENNEIEPEWIPVTTRPLDEEEKAYYSGIYGEDSITGIFDCRLPDCESCVLITTKYGVTTTNYDPEYGFEDYDAEEILAWMPLPRPYKMEVVE